MAQEHLVEKVSVNINASTLSAIDLLVDGGYYSNRSDFINQAVRGALERQQTTIDRMVESKQKSAGGDQWFIGVSGLTRRELEALAQQDERLQVRGYGVFVIDADCPAELLYRVVESIRVRGRVIAPAEIRAHYGCK